VYFVCTVGAVSWGCDPSIVATRKSRQTYGVAVQCPFVHGQHPPSKLVVRNGAEWCSDVFDALILTDQSVAVGDTIVRHYSLSPPAGTATQTATIVIFSSESHKVLFTSDSDVKKCGNLSLGLDTGSAVAACRGREIELRMTFGRTEISVAALDTVSGQCIRAEIDFMSR